MVAGVFMAVFLVGTLYHLIGVGRAVLYRERMQDFADGAAFEAAVGYARSMNEIGLANNIALVAVTNDFALSEAHRNIDACTDAAVFGGSPQDQCPPLQGVVRSNHESSSPELQALARNAERSAEVMRDATPGLVEAQTAAIVTTSGSGERRLVAAALVESPMPLVTAPMSVTCARAATFVRPLIEQSFMSSELIGTFDLPPTSLNRFSAISCPLAGAPRGPQVMSPPNQSGTEALQLRVIVVGAEQTQTMLMREHGVRLAERTIRRGEAAPPLSPSRQSLTRVGLAQAEYFSAWEHANTVQSDQSGVPGVMPEENTFYMHWRGRLRRLRVPVDVPASAASDFTFATFVNGPLRSTCNAACATGSSCGAVCGALSDLSGVGNNALQ
jgi:hypothetical protein